MRLPSDLFRALISRFTITINSFSDIYFFIILIIFIYQHSEVAHLCCPCGRGATSFAAVRSSSYRFVSKPRASLWPPKQMVKNKKFVAVDDVESINTEHLAGLSRQ